MLLGFGSLYNHSYTPTAQYIRDDDHGTIRIVALRALSPGDEITINYNGTPGDLAPVWFELSTTPLEAVSNTHSAARHTAAE